MHGSSPSSYCQQSILNTQMQSSSSLSDSQQPIGNKSTSKQYLSEKEFIQRSLSESRHIEQFSCIKQINKTGKKNIFKDQNDQKNNRDENVMDYIPTMNDDEVAIFVSEQLAGRLLKNKYFKYTIFSAAVVNSLLIFVETNKSLEMKYSLIFNCLEQCFMTVFICEMFLEWYHGFKDFWKQKWNILDFLLNVLMFFGPMVLGKSPRWSGVIRVLQVLRIFKSLRSISPGFQIILHTILHSVSDMASILILLIIIMLVFTVIGITLFQDAVPEYFGDLSTAMFSLFICITQDGWMDIFRAFRSKSEIYCISGGIFLVLFIVIGAFIFAQLVVAVVVTNFEHAVKVNKQEKQQHDKETNLDAEDAECLVGTLKGEDLPNEVFEMQAPLTIPILDSLHVRDLENYFIIITAMEDNLSKYLRIKAELLQIFDEVFELNRSFIADCNTNDTILPSIKSDLNVSKFGVS